MAAQGLFWEQPVRSNGLVRATLTFLSQEEGRAGEGAGQRQGDLDCTPTGVEEKGARGGLREICLGWGCHWGNGPLWIPGPLYPTPFTVLLKGITAFPSDSMEARLGTLGGDI